MRESAWIVVIILAVGAVGCRQRPPAARGDAWVFGVLPAVSTANTREVYQPLTDLLSGALDRPITLQVAADYSALQQELLAGRIHLAQASAYLYATIAVARAKDGKAVHLLAQERRTADNRHAGALVVKADSAIAAVADLAGKKIAWVDRSSSSGYTYPRLRLRELGQDPAQLFGAEVFAGSHDAVLRLVRQGEVDVGAVSEQSAATSGLRVVERTAPIPDDAILSLDALDTADRAAATRFFLGAHAEPRLANFFIARGLARYVAAEIAVYEAERQEQERSGAATP